MMDNNYTVRYNNLPGRVKGLTSYDSTEDFYTIVINSRLNHDQQAAAFRHEMRHIESGDFIKDYDKDISTMECLAHDK